MVHQIYIVFKASKIACYRFVNLFIDSTCNQSYFTIRRYDLSTVLSEIIRDIFPLFLLANQFQSDKSFFLFFFFKSKVIKSRAIELIATTNATKKSRPIQVNETTIKIPCTEVKEKKSR